MSLSFSEMLFIFVLAMIVFGPKKLPEIGRQIGKALNEFKRASNDFKSQLETEMRQIELEEALKKEKENISQILQSPLEAVATTGLGEASSSAAGADATPSGSAAFSAGWGAMDTTAPEFAGNAEIAAAKEAPAAGVAASDAAATEVPPADAPTTEVAAVAEVNAHTSPWDYSSDGHSSEIAVHQDPGPVEPVVAAVPAAGNNGHHPAPAAEPAAVAEAPAAVSEDLAAHASEPPAVTSDPGKGSNG